MPEYDYDLHAHTTTSDGKLHWRELLPYAKQLGLKGLAITNHNTLGPVEEIAQEARRLNLGFIPGTEVKTTCKAQIKEYQSQTGSSRILLPTQELLIYGIDPKNQEFLDMSRKHLKGKKGYVAELCRLLKQHSTSEIPDLSIDGPIEVDAQEIIEGAGSYVGATHVLEAIIKKYGAQSVSGKLTKEQVKTLIVDVQAEALKLMENDPFYGLDIVEGLKKAKTWGKEVAMAHPFTGSRKEMAEFYEEFLIPLLAENGLDGLEFSYPEHTEEQLMILERIAKRFGLRLTGGSDFHRKEDKQYRLGCCGVDRATFLELEERVK